GREHVAQRRHEQGVVSELRKGSIRAFDRQGVLHESSDGLTYVFEKRGSPFLGRHLFEALADTRRLAALSTLSGRCPCRRYRCMRLDKGRSSEKKKRGCGLRSPREELGPVRRG